MIKSSLVQAIVNGIQEKKGHDITLIDLSGMEGTVCSAFVVCGGNSPQQVEAITDSVMETVRIETNEKPLHVIGTDNAQWVAIDYGDVIVHIMLPDMREYYAIESLWEDAPITQLEDE